MKNTENNKKLYRRYLDDLYTTEDARQLLNSLHDPDNHETLNELSSDVWEETATQQPYTDLEREHYKREARQLLKHIEHKKRTWFHRIAVVTASTAAIVCLNSCSHVRHPNNFTGEERKIVLEGEGYFQVHRNEEQPFIVSTRRFDVRVLGTCFDIKSYSSDEIVSVEVESGKVQVDLPEAMMRLKGKEQVLINTISGEYSKRREERRVAIWKKGGLRFNSTPIRDVAKELERMYNCHITFANGKFNNLISGEHDNKSLEAVLQSIEYTSGIRYKKEGNHILLYK